MEREEVQVVSIEANGTVRKTSNASYNQWSLPVVYVLDDGRRIDASEVFSRKRDGVAFAATLPAAPRNPMAARFTDGRFWGTSTSYSTMGLMQAQARL